jgi:hypothetical protein
VADTGIAAAAAITGSTQSLSRDPSLAAQPIVDLRTSAVDLRTSLRPNLNAGAGFKP